MKRLTAIAFVAALALGCTDGDNKSPAAQPPTVAPEPPAASAAAEPAPAQPASASSPAEGPLTAGQKAPALDTVAHDGTAISMKALRGKPVVVYFYPRDATPG